MATTIHLLHIAHKSVGPLLLAATQSGLVRVQFGDDEAGLLAALERRFHCVEVKRASALLVDAGRTVQEYLDGGSDPSDVPIVLPEGGWSTSVWRYLKRIPRGQVRTYGAVAKALRNRGAARAVGQACGQNPLPLVLPCHRVVAANGGLGGFTGGLAIKKALLALEGAPAHAGAGHRRRA